MKETEACKKCPSTKLYVVDEVHRRHAVFEAAVVPMTVTAAQVDLPAAEGTGQEKKYVEAGRYEAWICAACGYTEWYATRLEELAVLAGATKEVRIIDRKAPGGPYRR